MKNCPDALLVLSHLTIQNANAVSSPLTWGFPSISAILGFVHALQRKLTQKNLKVQLGGTAVVCHKFEPQVYRANKFADYSFCLTRNPVDKNGNSVSFQEEGRVHLEISLIIQVHGETVNGSNIQLAEKIFEIAQTLRLAGGSIFSGKKTKHEFFDWTPQFEDQQRTAKKIVRRMLPGFALISREDLLAERTIQLQHIDPKKTALDALLEYSSINFEPAVTDLTAERSDWQIRSKPGWLVPIPVGFRAVSDLYSPGTVLNVRDDIYPFQFVENIYSLGQWLSPHRIENVTDIFWHYQFEAENYLYRCVNHPKTI